MRRRRIELGRLAGFEDVLGVGQEQPQSAGENVEPRVSVVGRQARFARPEDVLERPHTSGVIGEGNDDTPGRHRPRFEVHARITRGRCVDELIEGHPIDARQGEQGVEGRLPFTGFHSGAC